jgi:uncharacterized protein involved in exopolysaccharide biosynthesis/Mrp family chromosome partitioning ATPase
MRGKARKVVATPVMAAPVEGEASLGMIARALWRNKRRIVGPTMVITAAAFIAVNLMTPRFKSEARVLVEGRENIFLRPEAEKTMIERNVVDQEAVTSQVQLVLSRDLAREVIAKLDLAEAPEFNSTGSSLSPMGVLRMMGLAKDPSAMSVEERVLATYYERLSAYSIDKSRVIAIEFQSTDPELAARAANTVAENYLSMQQMAKQDQARSAGQWLSGELEKLRSKVSEAEAKVEEFRSKSNLFMGSNNTSLSSQQLAEVNTQVSALRAQKADAEAKAKMIRDTLRSGQSVEYSEIVNSELIRRLAEQRVTLRAQLAEQSSTLLDQHPRIKELKAQINDLDQQIRNEAERLVRTLEGDARIAGARLESLTSSFDQLKRQAATSGDQDVQLRALEREAKAQRDLFESYLAKYREATARDSIAAAPADARIISRAVVSNIPYFPKKLPIVLIAALGTFCLSSAFVVTGALLSASPGPAYRPAMPTMPALPTGAEPVVVERRLPRSTEARTRGTDRLLAPPLAPEAEAVPPIAPEPQTLAGTRVDDVAMALRQAGEGGRRVAVIGAARNVGTTLTAIALARSLARTARVVLVDLAFASPNVEVISNEPTAPGIADLVRGAASFGDVITRDRFSRLQLVAAGNVGGDAHGLLGSHMLSSAITALAQSYEYLVIDAGAQTDVAIGTLVPLTPRLVLVAGDLSGESATALRDQMRGAGFADVTLLSGPPPRLDHAATQSAAA